MLPDDELLRRYAERGDQAAFTELVERHANLAFRTALRGLGGDTHAARDAAQRVFTDLARKAASLVRHRNLAGWIHVSVRYTARDMVRADQRRRTRETQAMAELDSTSDAPWARVEPKVDELLTELPALDREALLLYFFEGHSFPEVGGLLAMSADAARMRVNRALERLRAGLRGRGLASSSAVLGEMLLTQSAGAAGLPRAAELAAYAMSRATQAGATGGSSGLAKGIHAVRAIPLGGWIAGILMVGGAAYYVPAWREQPPESTVPTAAQPVHLTAEAPEEELKPAPDEPTLAPNRPTGGSRPVTETGFADLTVQEKRILKILWSREVEFGGTPGKRWVVLVNPAKPNFPELVAARRALRLRGWVGVNRQGAIFFTEAGLAYCIGQRPAIDAFPMPNTRRANEPDEASDR
jgi:RNA polymerase sigma factor (sigma-70 family)